MYPVLSRRSGGLSLGINLFPDAKTCAFDCPYCEIFLPAGPSAPASMEELEEELQKELEDFVDRSYPESWAPEPIRDLCFSGNGEPTDSPRLAEALDLCARLRRSRPVALGKASLVLITNSTGFLDSAVRDILERACRDEGLVVWAKLDAGNEAAFRRMSGLGASPREPAGGLESIVGGLLDFARNSPIVLQTMLCEVAGLSPTDRDLEDYAGLLCRLLAGGARIREVHLYTYARPSPGGCCAALSDAVLGRRAAELRSALRGSRSREDSGPRVRAFGERGELA